MYFFLKALSFLPLFVLYGIGDLIFVIAFYLLRWRRGIASDNLARAFPEKSEAERYRIMRQHYRNLTILAAEVIWAVRQDGEKMRHRVLIENPEEVNKNYALNRSSLFMTAHFCNWEWAVYGSLWFSSQVFAVYKPQRVKGADRFLRESRTRFGAAVIPHTKVAEEVASNRRSAPRIYALVADQTPLKRESKFWATFLNQDTAFFVGTDRLARILQAPVYFPRTRRIRRGYYSIYMELIAEPPYRKDDEHAVTAAYVAALEREIRACPENWLWIHRKWKYEKNAETL
ncbi:MAG: hypothetical protein LBG61_06175 [Burkholderiales bacterium]|jgi:KDO2-lipid IV(A) lauroyltransferase|nr:hypothetical protein [Burkholderiales bacterium]